MTELYAALDKEGWISAPSFVRQRHRYRGQRESYKINVEIAAFRYDIQKLYEKYHSLSDYVTECLQKLLEGGAINAKYLTASDAVPALQSFTTTGINPLSLRMMRLEKRIRELETLKPDTGSGTAEFQQDGSTLFLQNGDPLLIQ